MSTSIKSIIAEAELPKQIKAVHAKAKTMRDLYHQLLVSAGQHYANHFNATLFTDIVKDCPKGVDTARMVQYVESSFGVVWNVNKKAFGKNVSWDGEIVGKEVDGKFEISVDHYWADGSRWYDYAKETKVPTWLLLKILKRANDAVDAHPAESKLQITDPQVRLEIIRLHKLLVDAGLPKIEDKAA